MLACASTSPDAALGLGSIDAFGIASVSPAPDRWRLWARYRCGHCWAGVLAVCLAGSAGACGSDPEQDVDAIGAPSTARVRGELTALTPLISLEREQVADYLDAAGLDTAGVTSGVAAYRLEYATIDASGSPTVASALVALPSAATGPMPWVTWLHGTTVYRGDVASMDPESDDRAAAFSFASAGFATTAPDYLGLGSGPGPHPYDDLPSEVTAAVDALSATRAWLESTGRSVEPTLAISGFSQGGPATLALGQALDDGALEGVELGALAAISGPYDMSGSLALAARGQIAYATAYLAYLSVAWNRLHGLYSEPAQAFLPPYAQNVEQLFDGAHTTEQVFSSLPETLEELFTPSFLDSLRTPKGPLERALAEADRVCDWHPSVPVRLFAASGDLDVPIANAHYCEAALRARGADVVLLDFGDVDHSTSVNSSLPRVLEHFRAVTGPGSCSTGCQR